MLCRAASRLQSRCAKCVARGAQYRGASFLHFRLIPCRTFHSLPLLLQVSGSMASVVKGMDRAMDSMNLEKISLVMDKFETQFEDMDVQTSYMEGAIGSSTASATPQDQVDSLMQQVADENGIEVNHRLGEAGLDGKVEELANKPQAQQEPQEDDRLAERLRALRPAV